jgi:hypothetical protein
VLKFYKGEFIVVNHVQHLLVVVKPKISQVTDIAEKQNLEPVADKIITRT